MYCDKGTRCPSVHELELFGYSVSRPARHTDATGLIIQIAIVESFSLSQLPSYTKSTKIFESVQGSDSKV
jgi:hypothetical protein